MVRNQQNGKELNIKRKHNIYQKTKKKKKKKKKLRIKQINIEEFKNNEKQNCNK